jgi:predicted phosphoadenosine phosphosulfate sulfurtransferase
MRRKILTYIGTWEGRGYPRGIPDEAPPRLEAALRVPSYRLICMAIMKNDVTLATLGYQRQQCAAYMAIKRIELRERGVRVDVDAHQLSINFHGDLI